MSNTVYLLLSCYFHISDLFGLFYHNLLWLEVKYLYLSLPWAALYCLRNLDCYFGESGAHIKKLNRSFKVIVSNSKYKIFDSTTSALGY